MALKDFTGHQAVIPWDGTGKVFLARNVINCYTSTGGGYGTWTNGDTARLLEIKEGWEVRNVWLRCVQKGTAGAVLDSVGDVSTGATAWVAADFNIGSGGTVGQTVRGLHTDTNGALAGFLYKADDYLLGTLKTADFNGIFEVVAEIVDVFGGLTIS